MMAKCQTRASRSYLAQPILLNVLSCGPTAGPSFASNRDDRTSDQRLEFGLQRVRLILFVNLLAPDIERKRFDVFCLLGRVVDGFFGPFIKMIIFDAISLGLADIIREGVELAFHDGMMPVQDIRQRRHRRIARIVPRHWREFVAQRQPQLEFQVIAHGVLPIGASQRGITSLRLALFRRRLWRAPRDGRRGRLRRGSLRRFGCAIPIAGLGQAGTDLGNLAEIE